MSDEYNADKLVTELLKIRYSECRSNGKAECHSYRITVRTEVGKKGEGGGVDRVRRDHNMGRVPRRNLH